MQANSGNPANRNELVKLENQFWKSLVDQDTDTALSLLDEPALMVSGHGAMQFDHGGYRKMAEQGSMTVKSYALSDMNVVFPTEQTAVLTYRVKQALEPRGAGSVIEQEMNDTSVWTHKGGKWLCVMHTETPVQAAKH